MLARYSLAEPLYRRASAIQEKAFGPDHPEVAVTLSNLAGQYYDQSQPSLAEPLLQQSASYSGTIARGQFIRMWLRP